MFVTARYQGVVISYYTIIIYIIYYITEGIFKPVLVTSRHQGIVPELEALDADEVEGNLMSKILQISHYFQNFLYEMVCQQFCMIIIILDADEVEGNLMSKIL